MRQTLWIALYTVLTLPSVGWAEISIFDVRRPISLNDTDKPQRDFYLNAGSESGLTSGMVLTVIRKTPLYDSYLNRSAGDLMIKVARVKIIHAQKGLAVARFQAEFSRDNNPVLEDNFLMVGDQIDLASASSSSVADKTAAAEPEPEPTPKPTTEAAPAPAAAPIQEQPPVTPAPEAPTPAAPAAAAAQKTTMLEVPQPQEVAHILVNNEEVSP